jgi:hypothetical protein
MAAPVEDTLLQAYPDIYDITQPDGAWGTEQGGKVGGAGADMQTCGVPAVPSLELCEGMCAHAAMYRTIDMGCCHGLLHTWPCLHPL